MSFLRTGWGWANGTMGQVVITALLLLVFFVTLSCLRQQHLLLRLDGGERPGNKTGTGAKAPDGVWTGLLH
jgi:hypothetical protein